MAKETYGDGQASSKDAVSRYINCDFVYLFVRWQVADDWFGQFAPQYTYSVKWTKDLLV
ncbi:hypothetical protein O9992_21010 [Vibrio lentus]|nr:hypothetical protein [Vibrio lentus]